MTTLVRRSTLAAPSLALALLLAACGGDREARPRPDATDVRLEDASAVVVEAVQRFRREHDVYPATVRLSGDRLAVRRGALGSDSIDAGVWDAVDLGWYVDRAVEREVSIAGDPGPGNSFASCVESGDRHTSVTGGPDGVATTGALPGPCGRP